MDNNKNIIKPSATTQISNTLTLMSRKCFNIFMYHAWNFLEEQDTFEMTAKDLLNYLNLKSHNYDHLEKTITDLMSSTITFNLLEKDKRVGWEKYTPIPYTKLEDGIITYQFEPNFKKKLINNEMYVKINLSIQNKFNSKYTLALYELCLDYYDKTKPVSYTPKITIRKFRDLIVGNQTTYKTFKLLNFHVIKKSINEINKLSDIQIKQMYGRNQNNLICVQFMIKKKHKIEIKEQTKENKFKEDGRFEEYVAEDGSRRVKWVENNL